MLEVILERGLVADIRLIEGKALCIIPAPSLNFADSSSVYTLNFSSNLFYRSLGSEVTMACHLFGHDYLSRPKQPT